MIKEKSSQNVDMKVEKKRKLRKISTLREKKRKYQQNIDTEEKYNK